jgi:hypothetical protein
MQKDSNFEANSMKRIKPNTWCAILLILTSKTPKRVKHKRGTRYEIKIMDIVFMTLSQ